MILCNSDENKEKNNAIWMCLVNTICKRPWKQQKALKHKQPEVEGIFAANDIMAIGAIKATHQLGKKIPKDLSIVGFDGIMLSKATMLVRLIQQHSVDKTFYRLDVKLVERQST